jgi:hypothetical protein
METTSRPVTPVSAVHNTVQGHPEHSVHSTRPMSASPASRPVSYGGTHHTDALSYQEHPQTGYQDASVLSQADDLHDDVPASATNEDHPDLPRSNSHMSGNQSMVSRGGTLKKKPSLHKSASLKRTASKRSSYAGSVRSMKLGEKEKYGETEETNNVFYCPVPTSGNPTELLANRFQCKDTPKRSARSN